MEGRRRVKEQLKKMGSFEYYQTSFSYTDTETGEERFVGVPEQGGRNMISSDPCLPAPFMRRASRRTERSACSGLKSPFSAGAGKLRTAGGVTGADEGIDRTRVQLHAGEERATWASRASSTSPTSMSK